MENEFGEQIPDERVKEVANRIAKLRDGLIDTLFYRCGLIYSEHDKNFKALNSSLLQELKKEKENSAAICELLLETPFEEVLTNLKKIEMEAG